MLFIKEILPYVLSFVVLFLAELFGSLRDIKMMKGDKSAHALLNAICSGLWCVKIAVVVSAPITIITGFIGAFIGVVTSYWITDRLNKK